MSAGTSQMSFWIKFFSDAGIPAGIAANYAVLFSEHRIQEDMLMDLTKEYLSEMGITTLGDVIAVLRHAKEVHTQSAREKALKGASSARSSPVPRRSTAASRTVSHYIGKDPDAIPMNLATPPTGPKISVELANRLGTSSTSETAASRTVSHYIGKDPDDVPMNLAPPPTGPKISMELANRLGTSSTSEKDTKSSVSKKISLKSTKEEVPVPKIRRVLPEHEGKYKVIMPKGTTEKTKKIIGQKQSVEKSVFARLGQSMTEKEPEGAKVTITGLGKIVMKSTTTSTAQSSVFNRLGGISTQSVKRPASSTCPDSDDSEDNGERLEYAGILKEPSAEAKRALLVKKKAIVVQRKKLMMQKKRQGMTQKPEVTTTTEGILAEGAPAFHYKKSALSRLGRKTTESPSEPTPSSLVLEDFTISKGIGSRLRTQQTTTTVSSRPGSQKNMVVSSSQDMSPHGKMHITRHLYANPECSTATVKKTTTKSGVFSRLGKPS